MGLSSPTPIPIVWTNPVEPNLADYQTWLYGIAQIKPGNLPATSGIIPTTLATAQSIVTKFLGVGGCELVNGVQYPSIYVQAVYNLATDRLVNWAADVAGQTYFEDMRKSLRIFDTRVGVPSQASDSGTAVSLLNPEQMKLFTLQDLQTLKTPYGRQYMAYAQMYGQSLWGLS